MFWLEDGKWISFSERVPYHPVSEEKAQLYLDSQAASFAAFNEEQRKLIVAQKTQRQEMRRTGQ